MNVDLAEVIVEMISIVVAFTKELGIGLKGTIPWHIPGDLKYFKEITKGSIVIMGRRTWESLPVKPLPGRQNVVITSKPALITGADNVMKITELDAFIKTFDPSISIMIIGGAALYERFMGRAESIYSTHILEKYDCDVYFPKTNFDKYKIINYSDIYNSDEKGIMCEDGKTSGASIKYRHVVYALHNQGHEEYKYLEMLQNINSQAAPRPDRTGVGTKSIFGRTLEFDISESIPLITTKQTAFRAIVLELLFFLRGETDSKILERDGVNIWKGNTTREFLDSRGLYDYEEGNMGPMYGHNWRAFGPDGVDQLEKLVAGLIDDPYSRRHMMTTYDPSTVDKCVLAPCHGLITQFAISDDGSLNCQTYCRSSDTFLGLPFNIASYAILTYIIAKKCGRKPGKLIMVLGDAHLYLSHIEPFKQLIKRNPLPFPKLQIDDSVAKKKWEEITPNDISLIGYLSWPAIKTAMAI